MGEGPADSWSAEKQITQLATPDLVVLLGALSGERRFCSRSLAGRIDEGRYSREAIHPDLLRGDRDGGSAFMAVLLELARRARTQPPRQAIERPEHVAAIADALLGGRAREAVAVVVCDSANLHLGTEIVSEGSLDRALFPVREILNAVLRRDGRAFAIAHNHLDRGAALSPADELVSLKIGEAAALCGLRFLGHVVVSDGRWSFATTQGQQTLR